MDFFFQENLNLGNLIIYGMSFGYNQIMPTDFLEEHPEHKNFHSLRSVDGHILSRVNILYLKNQIDKITISYYSEKDLENLKNIIGTTDFYTVVEFKQASQIFNFESIDLYD